MASADQQPQDDCIARILSAIRDIPDFPKPGILFHDITTLFLDLRAFKDRIDRSGKNGRLLNDYHSGEREDDERKLNACQIVAKESNCAITYEETHMKVWRIVQSRKRDALRMNIQVSIVPKEIKDTIWKLIKVMHYLYSEGDEYRRPGSTKEDVKTVLNEPIPLPTNNLANL